MNTLTKKLIKILLLVIILISTISLSSCYDKKNKNIYIVNKKILFNQFNMTKQTIETINHEFSMRKKEVDSLFFFIKRTNNTNIKLSQLYLDKKRELNEFKQKTIISETNKVWDRISVYTKKYGEEHGCLLILSSTDEENSVLFADKSIDITDDLINYINAKYEGQ